jgi:G3E family GTPase
VTAAGSKPVPVTVLVGFLGAGKTTVLNHLLRALPARRFGVIVNDLAEVNIDAELVRRAGGDLAWATPRIVDFASGCICCTLREDLQFEVNRLSREHKLDAIIVESTGVAEPAPIAQTFVARGVDGKRVIESAELDALVAVVSARMLLGGCDVDAPLRERGLAEHPEDDRRILEVMFHQIEMAQIVVLNKVDQVDLDERAEALALISRLNPRALLIEAERGAVNANDILFTGRFSRDSAARSRADLAVLTHADEKESAGVSSFVFRARRPFHPRRFHKFIESPWDGVLRSKGFFWLASRPATMGYWSHAGESCGAQPFAKWWIDTPFEEWPKDPESLAGLDKVWRTEVGDRRQELVFIGAGMDEALLRRDLSLCLLTDAEMSLGERRWREFDDPFGKDWDTVFAGRTAQSVPLCVA